ncbi:stage II sporulation protein Q [Pelagirhabdus alkalitolerans]|uniref:Stage II sporulation protein Q n=1 Tax=Pelagirhabdus alkalitolerans TaxID=1612202 RepID=A0A1G6GI08_9BACI|nr:M23 family metallopeptidase [Pelagirhabdus alkalitolerans]SDB81385.1 stage II sporulation protein Q [Pelagirhabdus alkalitolerans]
MNEEQNTIRSKWKRLIRKKAFFPAVYLSVAALLLTGVVWYQTMNRLSAPAPEMEFFEENESRMDPSAEFYEPSEPVSQSVEEFKWPVLEEAETEVVTHFYDFDTDESEQVDALIFYNNKYYQSQGISIVPSTDEPLAVVAPLSGEVIDVKDDPLLGQTIVLEHDHDLKTYYTSLSDVEVELDQTVEQGTVLAHAGTNEFAKDQGVHVQFEIRKNNVPVNPEMVFNAPVTAIQTDVTETEDES